MIEYADVIVDLQAGDTGKGKVAHHLLKTGAYNLVLRYNGGSNAGHTVYHNGQKIVTHQVPMGALFGITSVIGMGCVVNIPELVKEIRMLNSLGFYTEGRIKVDKRAHVVTESHLQADSNESKIGTTRRGIGPAYVDKYARTGTRIGDMDLSSITDFTVCDIYELFHVNPVKYSVLCEGAQGFQIDIDWGDYPYVTSSHCTVGSAILNGIPPQRIRKIIGTMKAYETYSGSKTSFMDDTDEDLKKLQEAGNEFGATTGRARKTRWLDMDGIIKAISINGITEVVINKYDILETVGRFKYAFNGKVHKCYDFIEFRETIDNILNNLFGTRLDGRHHNPFSSKPETIVWSGKSDGI